MDIRDWGKIGSHRRFGLLRMSTFVVVDVERAPCAHVLLVLLLANSSDYHIKTLYKDLKLTIKLHSYTHSDPISVLSHRKEEDESKQNDV